MRFKPFLWTALLALSSASHAGLNVSLDQLQRQFNGDFNLQPESPAEGKPRFMARSPDGLAILEAIGERANLSRATLVVGIPNDSADGASRSSARLLRFVSNTMPEWGAGQAWIRASLKKLQKESFQYQHVGKKVITMKYEEAVSLIKVTVEEK